MSTKRKKVAEPGLRAQALISAALPHLESLCGAYVQGGRHGLKTRKQEEQVEFSEEKPWVSFDDMNFKNGIARRELALMYTF